jgi:predicted phage terminase large subunit-like protein
VRPIIRNGGKIRLYGTIIHMDSLLERTMPDLHAPDTVEEGLRIYSKVLQKGWLSVKFRAHNEDFSRILWPSQFPKEKIRAIRKEFAEMGLLDVYGQEYLNDPIDESTAFFRKDDLKPMTDTDRGRKKRYYVGCDLAISERKKSAYTAFVIGGVDADKILHIVDVRRGHWDAISIIQEMWAINEAYGQPLFRFEEENIARTILPVIEHENMVRAKPILFDSKTPSKDKVARAGSFQYRVRAGKVRFDKSSDWYADYEQELTHFPKWRTLDQVDASSWLGSLIAEESEADTEAETADEAYTDMLETDFSLGRSMTTGY